MTSADNFFQILEHLVEFRIKHLPEKLGDTLPDIPLEGKLEQETLDKLKEFGIEDVEGTLELLFNLLGMMSAFIGEDISDSHFIGQRFAQDKLKVQIQKFKFQDFIFLQAVGHHNLSDIVKRFRVRRKKDGLDTGVKLVFADIDNRRVLFREGMGCTVTFRKRDRKKLRAQPDMSAYAPSYKTCKNGDLKLGSVVDHSVVDEDQLDAAIRGVFEKDGDTERGTKAVLIVHKGKLIREVYNNSETPAKYNLPEVRDDVHANTPLIGWSMTKSVNQSMMGAMIQQGMFGDYEKFYRLQKKRRISDGAIMEEFMKSLSPREYLPFLSNPRKSGFRDLNMNDLLHMASGLVWAEDELPFDVFQMVYRERDMARYAATKGIATPPSSKWSYSSGTANILAGVNQACFTKQNKTLKDYWTFPHESIFKPIGMCNATFQADIEGTLVGSSYCLSTARDWARFGLLYMNDGVVLETDQRILPKGWTDYTAMKALSDSGKDISGGIYGAQFWLNQAAKKDLDDHNRDTGYEGVPNDMYYPRGLFGQRVFIIPCMDLVVVRMGSRDKIGLKLFINQVVKAFKNKSNCQLD